MYVCVSVCCVCVSICICVCVYECVYVYVCIYVYMCVSWRVGFLITFFVLVNHVIVSVYRSFSVHVWVIHFYAIPGHVVFFLCHYRPFSVHFQASLGWTTGIAYTLHNTLLNTGIVSTRYTTHFSIQHLCTTLLHIGTVAIHYTPHHAGTVSMHLHTTLYTTRVSIHCTPYLYSPIMLFYSPIMLVYSLLRAGTGGR